MSTNRKKNLRETITRAKKETSMSPDLKPEESDRYKQVNYFKKRP